MVTFLTKEALEKLNTKRLLAYKKKLMKYSNNGCEFAGCDCSDYMMSKSRPEWNEVYNNIKTILATREHVEK
jgi:hypothetical protein